MTFLKGRNHRKGQATRGHHRLGGGRRREEEMGFTVDGDCVTPGQHCNGDAALLLCPDSASLRRLT